MDRLTDRNDLARIGNGPTWRIIRVNGSYEALATKHGTSGRKLYAIRFSTPEDFDAGIVSVFEMAGTKVVGQSVVRPGALRVVSKVEERDH
jgi:hypothetical protein